MGFYEPGEGSIKLHFEISNEDWSRKTYTFETSLYKEIFPWCFIDDGYSMLVFDAVTGSFKGYACVTATEEYFVNLADSSRKPIEDAFTSLSVVCTSNSLQGDIPYELPTDRQMYLVKGWNILDGKISAESFREGGLELIANGTWKKNSLPTKKPVYTFWRSSGCILKKNKPRIVRYMGIQGCIEGGMFYQYVPKAVKKVQFFKNKESGILQSIVFYRYEGEVALYGLPLHQRYVENGQYEMYEFELERGEFMIIIDYSMDNLATRLKIEDKGGNAPLAVTDARIRSTLGRTFQTMEDGWDNNIQIQQLRMILNPSARVQTWKDTVYLVSTEDEV